MKPGKIFKLSHLSAALMISLGISSYALAAEEVDGQNADDDVEVINVSGIRSSLINSRAIKQSAGNVVDVITAEDIGKFPDQNVAESLQRITGVSIDRVGGEGQLITVRGMGPEFNSVLFNNRTLATTSGGRAFSFDIFASELISGAEVHKTQSSALQEGAIGATVNITSLSPFDIPGFKAIGSVKGQYDSMTGKTKPQFSGLFSNTFDDDKFGVLFSFSSSSRESRYDEANTAYYRKTNEVVGHEGTQLYVPRNYDQIAQTEERDRTGGTLVLQYKPAENITLTADALYSKYDVKYRQDVLAHWFTDDNISNLSIDSNGTVEKLDVTGHATDSLVRQSDSTNELKAYGFNLEWDVTDRFSVVGDISYSEAEADPKKGWSDTVAGKVGNYSYDRSSGDLLPTMTFEPFKEGDQLYAGWANLQGNRIKDEVLEAKVDANYILDAGPLVAMDFGAFYSDRTLSDTFAETPGSLPWIYGDNSSKIFLPSSLFTNYDSDGFLSGGSGNPTQNWPTFNSDDLLAWLATDTAINQLDDPEAVRALYAKGGHNIVDSASAYEVNESLKAIYANFHFEGAISDMDWAVTAGARYVETTSTSEGKQIWLTNLIESQQQPNEVIAVKSEDYLPVNVEHSYKDFLPSINARLNITEDMVARFGYSKSLTRPDLSELSPITSYDGGKIDDLRGSGSNPKLSPYESTNLDLSLEYYYDEGSYASISGFKKDVDGYLSTEDVIEQITVPTGTYDFKITRSVNTNSTKIDGLELAVQHMFTSLPGPFDGLGVIANMTFTDSEAAADEEGRVLPLIGLGDSQNLIIFYEKDQIQFRVAYNNRDRFMQAKPRSNRDAHYVEDYHQIDVSASYDINDALTVFFEGINVTNELYIKNAEFTNQTLTVTETGPRYSLGIRAVF
ncbi:TonB-dependent receptor [Paraglaciecola arctica]|uniref:TonB-dependent receptor n=1 Tax=Paraglaciecola arctica BSs20135 TaxID=493475 RepID=K6YED2_9ALTE|nr:TonB-dependent receptor [Paraglaciecola arctica]GAC22291.1 hypothetical protein GARC_5356 [Paraglaciecola arctica BSs20135]